MPIAAAMVWMNEPESFRRLKSRERRTWMMTHVIPTGSQSMALTRNAPKHIMLLPLGPVTLDAGCVTHSANCCEKKVVSR